MAFDPTNEIIVNAQRARDMRAQQQRAEKWLPVMLALEAKRNRDLGQFPVPPSAADLLRGFIPNTAIDKSGLVPQQMGSMNTLLQMKRNHILGRLAQ